MLFCLCVGVASAGAPGHNKDGQADTGAASGTLLPAPVPNLAVAVPAGTESWPSGSVQTLGWTLSEAVDAGQFGAWLVDQVDVSKWHAAGFYDALPGESD